MHLTDEEKNYILAMLIARRKEINPFCSGAACHSEEAEAEWNMLDRLIAEMMKK